MKDSTRTRRYHGTQEATSLTRSSGPQTRPRRRCLGVTVLGGLPPGASSTMILHALLTWSALTSLSTSAADCTSVLSTTRGTAGGSLTSRLRTSTGRTVRHGCDRSACPHELLHKRDGAAVCACQFSARQIAVTAPAYLQHMTPAQDPQGCQSYQGCHPRGHRWSDPAWRWARRVICARPWPHCGTQRRPLAPLPRLQTATRRAASRAAVLPSCISFSSV